MANFPRWENLPPRNDAIDYERAGALEAAIRKACHEYLFTVGSVVIKTDPFGSPIVEIVLRQQPGRTAT